MVNEILMRGATPIAMPQPVEAPAAPAGSDDFSKALLAELDGPAPAATQGLGAPVAAPAAPKAITLETIPVAPPVMVAPPAPPAPAAGNTYTVQAGDSLSKIARQLGHGSWNKLYAANKAVIGANPNMILPGQVLTLPPGWQVAATAKVAHAPSVKAAVEAAAPAPTVVAGTPPAQVPGAPDVAPPSLPVEAAHEGQPAEVGTVAAPEIPTSAIVGVATEAIDRLTAEPGGQDHVATLREALNSIPPGHASYGAYKAKVEAYEAAVGATGAAPLAAPPAAAAPPMAQPPVDAMPSAYGPDAPAGATIDAQLTQPAVPVVQPAEDAGDASPEGDEDWQAFS